MVSRMTPVAAVHAAKIMESLELHPCCKPFIDDEKFDNLARKRFEELIIEPVTINSIKEKLSQMKYETVNQWNRDVHLIYDNAATFYGRYSSRAILAQELIRLFDKEYLRFVSFSLTKWSRLVGELSHRAQFMLHKMPVEQKAEAMIRASIDYAIPNDDYIDFEPETIQIRPEPIPEESSESSDDTQFVSDSQLSENEINNFLDGVSELNSVHDVRSITQIITSKQPELELDGPEAKIEIKLLRPSTMRHLINYVKERLTKFGKEYPH